ncbi:hypothetical protein Nepgr_009046 [Nepenthes gracilis]|uniref:Uncharacterized protein n=1 Tax=Nepenthes gracilis TaxID=150966 RepID=A0AAD3SAM8_NEPGR|nr:hypothetical protein Nepgr_009046 [Nepenthes gracilis]
MNRVWMAGIVAVVNSNTDQDYRWKSAIKSFQPTMRRHFPGDGLSNFRPLATVAGTDLGGLVGGCTGDVRTHQADESIRRVMFMNCWGQS